jgi:hypothetical protein
MANNFVSYLEVFLCHARTLLCAIKKCYFYPEKQHFCHLAGTNRHNEIDSYLCAVLARVPEALKCCDFCFIDLNKLTIKIACDV